MKSILIPFTLLFFITNCNNPVVDNTNNIKNENHLDTVEITRSITKHDIGKYYLEKFNGIIPKGYNVYDLDSGNLNLDTIIDYILIIRDTSENLYFNPEFNKDSLKNRLTLLVIGLPKDSFYVAATNRHVVPGLGSGGATTDPYEGIKIDDGTFCFEFQGGRENNMWAITECFKYNKKEDQWFLYSKKENDEHFYDSTQDSRIKTQKDYGLINFNDYGE